ncbi:hypothetical protein C1J03_23760 (plasmid) [Sulfitobacter sp. SK012]|uniref:hypothetical protein n=1 Tax=Sulfitobacter sp. SK012 TaxID=1389005 RepID=UPI000E0BEF66|nr:hypothetical protein [Sulfitobacter sp. SK012]AXI49133.1 hypothetical protein C1J03_23760 [Sulfitobacter sp. SK012]
MHDTRSKQNTESTNFTTKDGVGVNFYYDFRTPSQTEARTFLVDTLRSCKRVLAPNNEAWLDQGGYSDDFKRSQLKLAGRVLSASEHYAFDFFALAKARSLKISTPLDLQHVVQSVLSGPPKTIWLEADLEHRLIALSGLNRFSGRLLTCYEPATSRVGLLVEILGNGKATLRTVSFTCDPEDASTPDIEYSPLDIADDDLMSTYSYPASATIDVSQDTSFPTLDAFKSLLNTGDQTALSHYAATKSQSTIMWIEQLLSDREITEAAWWRYCIEQMISPDLNHDAYDELYINDMTRMGYTRSEIIQEAQQLLSSEFINMAALLSVLSAAGRLSKDADMPAVEHLRSSRDANDRSQTDASFDRKLCIVSLTSGDSIANLNAAVSRDNGPS